MLRRLQVLTNELFGVIQLLSNLGLVYPIKNRINRNKGTYHTRMNYPPSIHDILCASAHKEKHFGGNKKGRLATAFHLLLYITSCMPYGIGFVTVPFKVTAACASSLPFTVEPVPVVIAVPDSITPSMCAGDPPMVAPPPTCQKMFLAFALPPKRTIAAAAVVRVPGIWTVS